MKTKLRSRCILLAAASAIHYCEFVVSFRSLISSEFFMRARLSSALLFISCAVLFTAHAHAAYKYAALPSLGGPSSFATGINNAGQVVGTSNSPDVFPRTTVWTAGSPTDARPGDYLSWGHAINDSGQVAGNYGDYYGRFGTAHAYASPYSNASMGNLGVSDSIALDINNNGLVVGEVYAGDWAGPPMYPFPFYGSHAVIWNGTTTTDLHPAGADISIANAINDSNVIVGAVDGQAVVWNGGVINTLGAGAAFDINNAGVIAGRSDGSAVIWDGGTQTILGDGRANALNILSQVVGISNGHAFLWENGVGTDLNNFISAAAKSAGWILQEAVGINDHGWIVGNAYNTVTLDYQAFLLSPAPEPSTWAMLLGGLGFIVWRARKTRRVAPALAAG
jgi:uncharacterized membrane protein